MKKQTQRIIAGATILGWWQYIKTKKYLSNLTIKTGQYLNNINPDINTFVAQENTFNLRLFITDKIRTQNEFLDNAIIVPAPNQPFITATIKRIHLYNGDKEIAVTKEVPKNLSVKDVGNYGFVFIPKITETAQMALAGIKEKKLVNLFENADVKIVWQILPLIETPIAYKTEKVSVTLIEPIIIPTPAPPQPQENICKCNKL